MARTDAHAAAEVLEDDATPVLQRIYGDVKSSLRVPIVNLVFRVLANYPDYLQLAWRQLQPNVQTLYFEHCADSIRARAVEGMSALGGHDTGPVDPATREILKVFHYVNPKLLLAVAALRAATGGQYPNLERLPADEKRQITSGVPQSMPLIAMVDPATAPRDIKELFDDMMETLGVSVVNSDYRALAASPAYLQSAWSALKPLIQHPGYVSLQRDLRLMAEEAILKFPFRMEVNPHIMRLCGMSEDEIDEVRGILNRFNRLLPGLIANVSFFSLGAFGHQDAMLSPYPASTL